MAELLEASDLNVIDKDYNTYKRELKWLEAFTEMYKRNHHYLDTTETLAVNDIERLIALANIGVAKLKTFSKYNQTQQNENL